MSPPLFSLLLARLRWAFIQAWEFWIVLAAVTGTVLAWLLANELQLRSYGFAMQVAGALTVAYSVFSNERLFGLPRFKDRVSGWLARYPGRHHVLTGAAMGTGAQCSGGRVSVRHAKPITDDLDIHIEKIWLNFEAIDKELSVLFQNLDRNKQANAEALAAEIRFRETEVAQLRKLVQSAAVDSPMVAYLGVFVAILGSAISTYSTELHILLHS